ncbi:helix-turn-helix domain-containing protein [Halobacteria archaeon AArc-curdl1]|uniref:Helix-turn-helix domain-containing protein n=1 Tax=Natronosalvus hydrolyticus TaxID=2979988 RepID=A0AAP3E801_9EURY|nr:helix-turn-helix domain-containing protein [Halobacteria archaeon AArc-curdl1]
MNGHDSSEGPLDSTGYDAILDGADTFREALVVRLCGEVGLRPAEIAALTPDRLRLLQEEPPRYGLDVPVVDHGGRSDSSGVDRTAYVPVGVEQSLRRYATSNDIDGDARLFPVTPRRLQMLVAEVTTRASEKYDDPSLETVSSSELRQYFARHALVDHEINPRVVKAVGGWHSFEALEPYLEPPTAERIVSAFAALEPASQGDAVGTDRTSPLPDDETDVDDTADSAFDPRECHGSLTTALLEAPTHEAIETAVCDVLIDSVYELAWIDRSTISGDSREHRTVSGEPEELIEATAGRIDGLGSNIEDPALESSVRIEQDIVADSTLEGGVATIPITYGDSVYGVLGVGTDRSNAFGEGECTWLETVARQVGHAIAAVRRRNLLFSDTVVELEFHSRDDRSFFVETSRALECCFALDSLVPVEEGTHLYYMRVTGTTPDAVFDRVADAEFIEDCRVIDTYEDGSRLEFVVSGASPTLTLMEYGVTILESVTEAGSTTITAECASDTDIRTIVGGLRRSFPDSELVGKRTLERSVQTAQAFHTGLEDRLTDRQEASLRAAYFGGYYDWPRESTAEEIADAMGVSSPTLHNHLRKGQHELLRTFFDADTVEEPSRRSSR